MLSPTILFTLKPLTHYLMERYAVLIRTLLLWWLRGLLIYTVTLMNGYASPDTVKPVGCKAYVQEQARLLATKPYQVPAAIDETAVRKLDYDGYRHLRFRPEKTVWRQEQLPFQLEPLPPGLSFRRPVSLYTWEQGEAKVLPFQTDYFESAELLAGVDKTELGFTGFRILYPLKKDEFHSEFFVFQGASYFRSRSIDQVYGLSVRGLGINTDLEGQEEFPDYRAFWIEKPTINASTLTLCALLDSPSVTGMSEFIIKPGHETTADVDTVLYWRNAPLNVAVSPLTSMYFHGENSKHPMGDYRPEVHDSDGLLIDGNMGLEWHPLYQPAHFTAHSIASRHLRGFGLLQRDRNFDHYQDLEAHYQERTNVWVTPLNDWGAGAVRLVHFPTQSDVLDNVVAYWQPEQPQTHWQYRLTWLQQDPPQHQLGKVHATRIATKNVDSLPNQEGVLRFFIDFKDILPTTEPIEIEIGQSDNLLIQSSQLLKNPYLKHGQRLVIVTKPIPERCQEPMVVFARLKAGAQPLSEMWVYPISSEYCQRN
ncbi:glucan biosynthesis protein [Thiofilum flexile]|uniref:glucan biosynthesis protein n=1 Tax=Thiofilum flexile TaxID=125627 RepID=UPI000371470B|nr:glucan biosynthesis protein [Thiofilum flexile]